MDECIKAVLWLSLYIHLSDGNHFGLKSISSDARSFLQSATTVGFTQAIRRPANCSTHTHARPAALAEVAFEWVFHKPPYCAPIFWQAFFAGRPEGNLDVAQCEQSFPVPVALG